MEYFIYPENIPDAPRLRVAVSDLYDEFALERLHIETGKQIQPEYHSETEIRQMIRASAVQDSDSLINALKEKPVAGNANSWESAPIINLVDSLLDTALKLGVTDIHLEPSTGFLRIRFRKDGLLQDYRQLPEWITDSILVRLKILSNVDITERRLPHDGSFTFHGTAGSANIRLSTLPVQNAECAVEKCVLRLLPAQDEGQTLDALGFSPAILRRLREIFQRPQGLFLITGPTGSGKTSTLYAGLREILHREINVSTIEDPVEYKLAGANQVQVNEKCGFTFAAALRSILRQDPDVILIGEIRDAETARIALQAAQTGHLVLATLHTNSARAATARLADLGVSGSALQEALLGVVAQRLVRHKRPDGSYRGRSAVVEFLNPEGSYVEGTLLECGQRLVREGVTDTAEIHRVLGN